MNFVPGAGVTPRPIANCHSQRKVHHSHPSAAAAEGKAIDAPLCDALFGDDVYISGRDHFN